MSNSVELTATGQVLVTEVTEQAIEVQAPGTPLTVEVATAGPQGPPPDLTAVDVLGFDTAAAESVVAGQLAWNATEGTLDVGASGITYQLGQELSFRCKNVSADPIVDGEAVMFMGADASTGYLEVAHMVADGSLPGYVFFGVATEPIAIGAVGYVTTLGKVRGLDTSAYAEDAILYCDPANPGEYTDVEPNAPNLKLQVAAVIKSHPTDGVIFVRANNGQRIQDCHDVDVSTVSDGDVLTWVDSANRWEHRQPTNGSAPRSITIAAPQPNDSFTLFRTTIETEIQSVVALVSGGSVSYEIRYATDRTTTGTLAASDTVTNTTTGDTATLQNQPIPAGRYVWVGLTAVTGTVSEFNLSIGF
jgi:hypothetical protein